MPVDITIGVALAARMEMVIYGGKRLITGNAQIGPVTPTASAIISFEHFWEIFKTQLDWLIGQAVEMNEYLGAVHQEMMPSPLLSAFFESPMENVDCHAIRPK